MNHDAPATEHRSFRQQADLHVSGGIVLGAVIGVTLGALGGYVLGALFLGGALIIVGAVLGLISAASSTLLAHVQGRAGGVSTVGSKHQSARSERCA